MHGSEQGGEKGTAAISLAHILKMHGDKQRRPLTAELHLAPGHVARPRSAPGAPPHPRHLTSVCASGCVSRTLP